MQFDPEDGQDFGPHCRNCHKGSSSCETCHEAGKGAYTTDVEGQAINPLYDKDTAAAGTQGVSVLDVNLTSTGATNMGGFIKQERSVDWSSWTDKAAVASPTCSDDGFSWPHRTLGYMMLKDDLFGVDVSATGTLVEIGPGVNRTSFGGLKTHDIDSVCIDCHNPTIFNATSLSHDDATSTASDDYNDELLLRGLP